MLLTVRTMEILVLVLTESQGRHNSSCFIWEPPSFSLQAPERMFPNGLIFHVTEREVLSPSLNLPFHFHLTWTLWGEPLCSELSQELQMGHVQIPELPWASKGRRYTSLDGCPSQPCSDAGLCALCQLFSCWAQPGTVAAIVSRGDGNRSPCGEVGCTFVPFLQLSHISFGFCLRTLGTAALFVCFSHILSFFFHSWSNCSTYMKKIFSNQQWLTHLAATIQCPLLHTRAWDKDRDRSWCNGKGHHREFSGQLTPSKVQEGVLRRKMGGQGVQQWLWHRAGHPLPSLPRGFASMDICVWSVGSGWGRQIQTDGQGRIEGLWPALLSLPVSQLLGTLPGVGSGVNMGRGRGSTKRRPLTGTQKESNKGNLRIAGDKIQG